MDRCAQIIAMGSVCQFHGLGSACRLRPTESTRSDPQNCATREIGYSLKNVMRCSYDEPYHHQPGGW
ncbi:hypothetical protein CROQUDRAFT_94925 [Cronartium quercuum f. sp. fusiforme G11]|uniref:Uncharacterized protein n=1 Tax=Cronartium quercuum f. sp. fusiforme G11 TaxID=708437 RepID=A0A9P6T9X1_9BASI|nr:hypothetical protein CROQUDRAFT_94925 [Cronartium quercuum f. sp. fusiforme G11]